MQNVYKLKIRSNSPKPVSRCTQMLPTLHIIAKYNLKQQNTRTEAHNYIELCPQHYDFPETQGLFMRNYGYR